MKGQSSTSYSLGYCLSPEGEALHLVLRARFLDRQAELLRELAQRERGQRIEKAEMIGIADQTERRLTCDES